jgi:zeta-carotene desaturase
MPKPNVTIVGAGIAGLTAGLRLAERGYQVTFYERDWFVGGKFRAFEWIGKETNRRAFHEHSYHLFLNWYHNFFAIADEIDARKHFMPLKSVKFLRQGQFPQWKELVNFGSLATIPQNLFSGVLPIPDMFLYMYSVIDLLGTPMKQNKYRDLISVNAFASTKPYATERSVSLYDEYLAKTFAIASYLTAAKSFQTFSQYNAYCPDPMYWALDGDSFNRFLAPLQAKLKDKWDAKFNMGHNVEGLILNAHGHVTGIRYRKFTREYEYSGSLSGYHWDHWNAASECQECDIEGPLILAVPHAAFCDLLSADMVNRSPHLGEIAKLESEPMASVHLHLNDKFAKRLKSQGITLPKEPVVLVDSDFKLSFVANSSLWPGSQEPYLNVVASDSRPLNSLNAPDEFTWDRDRESSGDRLSLHDPVTTLDHILNEFRKFVHFEEDEIDKELLQIDRNVGRELFINEIGSWKWRPQTRTKIKNLFLAGDFCKNSIDVVCLEGAVVSGLEAAECVRVHCGQGSPIKIERPKRHPYPMFWPWKFMLAPYAAGAWAWSTYRDLAKRLDLTR